MSILSYFNRSSLWVALAVVNMSSMALAASTQYSYTSLGQLETVNGPRTDLNDITRFAYDAQGNLASVTNALGHVTRLANYDVQGNPQKITDPNGAVTTLSYTTNGLLASTTLGSRTTRFDYNAVGDVIKVTGGNGNWVEYTYDNARRLKTILNILGESITYTLDTQGNRTAEVIKNSSGAVVRQQRRAFDELGRLVQVVGAANQTRRYSYDLNDNLSSDTSARSHKTQQSFDALNRVIKIVDPLQGSTSLAYNADDRVTQVVDPRGVKTQYAYDGQGNLLKTVSPDTGTSAFVYDEANNLIRSTDARGVVTEYTYDALNRLITKNYPSTPALNIKFLYDQTTGGNYGIGRRTGIQDSAGLLSYSYDVQGNLAGQQRTVGVNSGTYSETLTYGYDAAGNLIKMGYPSSIGVTYARNTAGQVAGIQLAVAGKTVTLASNIAYQPFGPVRTLTWGNGILLSKTYDQDYQLTQQHVGNWQTTYRYDADSNISSTTHSLWGAVQYEYDALGRLTQEQNSTIKKAYTLDATGNRTRRTTSNLAGNSTTETQTLAYASDSNRLTSINGATAPVDAAGNHTPVNGLRLTYDSQGRLSQVHQASIYQIAEYKYNALGQRVSKRVYDMGSQALIGTTTYLYGPNGKLIGQTFYDANGLKTSGQYWFWLDDMPLAQLTANFSSLGEVSSSKLVYLHSDHLNTPRLATDSTQALQWRWSSDAYGVGKPDEDVDGDGAATSVALRFPGQIYDAQTQLNYNYYRDYNPETGRYVQSDPIGLAGGLNTFGYAYQNPVNYFDPDGRLVWFFGLGALGGTGAATSGAGFWGMGAVLGGAAAVATIPGSTPMYAKPKPGSKPKNCPSGTIPIDQVPGLDKDDLHGVKDGVGAGPRDWTGVAPNGDVITGDSNGEAVNNGPISTYLP